MTKRKGAYEKTISVFYIFGVLLLTIAFVFALLALNSFIERTNYGPGLFFADVEFFGFIAFFCLMIGIVLLWIGKRTKRNNSYIE